MTKLYRAIVYVLDLNGDVGSPKSLKYELENAADFSKVLKVNETEIGPWEDNHPLNSSKSTMVDYDKYFPELKDLTPEKENQVVVQERELRMKAEEKSQKLEREVNDLKRELAKLQEIGELVKKIKG